MFLTQLTPASAMVHSTHWPHADPDLASGDATLSNLPMTESRDLLKVGFKLLGTYFLVAGISSLLQISGMTMIGAANFVRPSSNSVQFAMGFLPAMLAPIVQSGLGLLLLFATEPLVRLCWAGSARHAVAKYRDAAPPVIQPPASHPNSSEPPNP